MISLLSIDEIRNVLVGRGHKHNALGDLRDISDVLHDTREADGTGP